MSSDTNQRPPYGECPACEGSRRIVFTRARPEPETRKCIVCDGTGSLDNFGCPVAPESVEG